MRRTTAMLLGIFCLSAAIVPASAQTVMQRCGQEYQSAKAAGTLNGMSWNKYRTDCAARLKATPASEPVPPPAAAAPPAPPPAATTASPVPPKTPAPVPPATATAPKPPATGGRASMLSRQKQCGAEWRAQKTTLVAQTPGLTWPKYWSQCNARLKAAGQ